MPSQSLVSASTLKGGFRYKHRSSSSPARDSAEPRKRLGTTVSQATYEELLRLTKQYKLRFSQILDEAIQLGLIEKPAEPPTNQRH